MSLWGNPVFVSYKEQIACTAVQALLQDDVMEEAHGETPEQMDGEGERAEDGSDHEQEDALGRICCCCASIVGC